MEKQQYKKKLSIIIPHYNTPDLLRKLLDSIPSEPEIQVVVIDDGSNVQNDKLIELQKSYCDHVEFYQNDTGIKGAGTCRNIGLQHAEGKWILFADADDFFVEGMYGIVSRYFETDYGEVFFMPTSIYLDTGETANRHTALNNRISNYIINPENKTLLKMKISARAPWSTLISHKLITDNGIRFDEVLYSNDIMFMAKAGYYSKKVAASTDIIYCVTRNRGSLTTQVSWDAFEIRLHEYIKVCEFVMDKFPVKDVRSMQYTCMGMLYSAVKQHYGLNKYIQIVRQFKKHGIPLFSWEQVHPNNVKLMLKDFLCRRSDSKYSIKG